MKAARTTQERSRRTQARLFEAFWQELATVGLAALTVEGVLRRARVSKGSFYHHFRNKQALLHAAYRAHTKRTLENISTQRARGTLAEDAIIGDVLALLKGAPHPGLVLAMVELKVLAARDPMLSSIMNEDYRDKLITAERLLREDRQKGHLRSAVDARAASHAIYAGIFGTYLMHFAAQERDDIAPKVERFLRTFFRGLK